MAPVVSGITDRYPKICTFFSHPYMGPVQWVERLGVHRIHTRPLPTFQDGRNGEMEGREGGREGEVVKVR